jgi:hypothetical protein
MGKYREIGVCFYKLEKPDGQLHSGYEGQGHKFPIGLPTIGNTNAI